MVLKRFFSTKSVSGSLASFGLLVLRVAISAMMLTHGLAKIANFSTLSPNFDLIGIGGDLSLALVIFAEVFCSIALILGFLTRLATFPLIFAMGVAIFIKHAADAFTVKELALLYLTVYVVLLLTGPGRYSVDRAVWR